MTERDLDREYRAYQLLRWSTPAPLAEFNEELAAEGFYSRIQKERSDKALYAFEDGVFLHRHYLNLTRSEN